MNAGRCPTFEVDACLGHRQVSIGGVVTLGDSVLMNPIQRKEVAVSHDHSRLIVTAMKNDWLTLRSTNPAS